MKKILILLFSILISFNSLGVELDRLFGISLYENAGNYVSSNYIDSNKIKHRETHGDYFNVDFSEVIPEKSPYFSFYRVTINNNKIHSIYGAYEFDNLSRCQDVQKSLLSDLKIKYQIETQYSDISYPEFKIYTDVYITDSNNYFALQCKETYPSTTYDLQMFLDSSDLDGAIRKFYDSGL